MSAVDDAVLAAALFAIDPTGVGGICVRSQVQPARAQWLQIVRELLPPEMAMRRIPCNIEDGRLLGGLDLVATLRANRVVAEQGVLAAADGGVILVSMAERLSAHTAACLSAVLDLGEVSIARESIQLTHPARIGIVALDEGINDDEAVPRCLSDRFAFLLDFNRFNPRTGLLASFESEDIVAARLLFPQTQIADHHIEALAAAALTLGAGSARISVLAARVARLAAALDGRTQVEEDDVIVAGRLVLAPRATLAPERESPTPPAEPPPSEAQAPDAQPPDAQAESQESNGEEEAAPVEEMASRVVAATQAAIPAGLLSRMQAGVTQARGSSSANNGGRAGALCGDGTRGRPIGIRSGALRGGARLNVLATLRSAAPWQRLRGRALGERSRLQVQSSDFKVTRFKQRSQTLTIFVVDASGSAAMQRLAEAKGAVELLLADCYIRRDQVAVIAFRGRAADILLPPTRSLVRAKRSLAGLPGGGATPLATALQAGLQMVTQARRRGETATLVMLTDGRANVSLNGTGGRDVAQRDAMQAAATLRQARVASIFVDTSPRPSALGLAIAAAMDARYVALPVANPHALSAVVQGVTISNR